MKEQQFPPPDRLEARVLAFLANSTHKNLELPLALELVPAGFPSPAEGYLENRLDITDYLVKHPNSTFFMKVTGDSMINAGINDGDLLVIDKAESARHGSIVVATVNGELCVKELRIVDGRYQLHSANERYDPIEIRDSDDTQIWGVVTHAITDLKKSRSIRISKER